MKLICRLTNFPQCKSSNLKKCYPCKNKYSAIEDLFESFYLRDADPVWSSKTDGIAHSCDSSWKEQLGFTCSCSKSAVDCKRMNISNIKDLGKEMFDYFTVITRKL